MKTKGIVSFGIALCLAATATATHAQFVKGNEAVATLPDGTKRVETPPLPSGLGPPCAADRAGCAAGGWLMVETSAGLMECTEFYARSGTCRASTYGTQKVTRRWVVKTNSKWMQCQFPDLASNCVGTKSLPLDAVQ